MNEREAVERVIETRKPVWCARWEGRVWSAGRMVDCGDLIGYFETKAEADRAAADHERFDFDKEHCCTIVEEFTVADAEALKVW